MPYSSPAYLWPSWLETSPDVAAPGGVLLVPEGLGHQDVPQVGDLPEVDVREAGARAGEAEAGQGRHDDVERVGGVTAGRGRVGERADHLDARFGSSQRGLSRCIICGTPGQGPGTRPIMKP